MQAVAKPIAQQPSLNEMVRFVRDNHIDIIPILKEELQNIIPQYIHDIIQNVYINILEKGNE